MKSSGDEVRFPGIVTSDNIVCCQLPDSVAYENLAGRSLIEKGKCQEFVPFSSEQANQKEWG